jgi:DNA processing protein
MPLSSPTTGAYKDILTLSSKEIPPRLKEITDPPKTLYIRGALPSTEYAMLAIVGSRKHTAYGKDVVTSLVRGLRGYPVAIISGLALGIDGLAHKAALDAGLPTLAVPGSGLDWNVLYPRNHERLAKEILEAGGGLLSEFSPETPAAPWTFPKRNRIMAGLADAVLIIEAEEQSGTLITARLAMEYNRDVLAVPGPITSTTSRGPNALIRDGAIPILSPTDILDALGISAQETPEHHPELLASLSEKEQEAYLLLSLPLERDALFNSLELSPEHGNILLLELEMKGLIRTYGGLVMRV